MMSNLQSLKELPPLMPQFLQKRRAGIAAPRLIAKELGIEPPLVFTLVQIGITEGSYGGGPLSPAQLRSRTRHLYSTIDHLAAPIAALKEKRLIREDAEGCISLSPDARRAVDAMQEVGRAYVARLQPLPNEELEGLTRQFKRAVDALLHDPMLAPRPGSHLAGSRSLDVAGPDAPVMVRLEQAVYDLWLARDDSHIEAWRNAEMEGSALPALTVLWLGEANTVSGLAEKLQDNHAPEDLASILAYLFDKDYVVRDGDEVKLTPTGVLVREDIERETDRIYFASWPHSEEEAAWMRDKFREVVDNIPTPPSA